MLRVGSWWSQRFQPYICVFYLVFSSVYFVQWGIVVDAGRPVLSGGRCDFFVVVVRTQEIKKQTSHLHIIKKYAECVEIRCVSSGSRVWLLSVLKALQHLSVHHKDLSVNPKLFCVHHKHFSVLHQMSTCDLTICRLPMLGRTGHSAGRVKSSSCLPTLRACYIAYKSAIVSMTKKRNLNNSSGKFGVQVICIPVSKQLK
jgi:hypothetical protein